MKRKRRSKAKDQLRFVEMAVEEVDYSQSKLSIPISGGINSAAILCLLGEYHPRHLMPKELHLYYSHFDEHSPDTFKFVCDLMCYGMTTFPSVKCKITQHSVNKFFIKQNMIPHPTLSPCSIELKIKPREAYDKLHGIDYVLIGFVEHEGRRHMRSLKYGDNRLQFPLLGLEDADCLALVKKVIGWYPAIYDIKWTFEDYKRGECRRSDIGKPVFLHNNCLPCKNMTSKQLVQVGKHYPTYAAKAMETQNQIEGGYWGRDDVLDIFKCDSCERFA